MTDKTVTKRDAPSDRNWFDGVLFKKKALDLPIVFGILAAFCVHWIIVLIEYFAK